MRVIFNVINLFFLFTIFFSCYRDKKISNIKNDNINSTTNYVIKDKMGKIMKTFICNNIDRTHFLEISRYYSDGNLILVEEKTNKDTSIYFMDYSGLDSSISYNSGYFIYKEYLNNRGVSGLDDPYNGFREYFFKNGRNKFIKYLNELIINYYNIKLSESSLNNLIIYLTFAHN